MSSVWVKVHDAGMQRRLKRAGVTVRWLDPPHVEIMGWYVPWWTPAAIAGLFEDGTARRMINAVANGRPHHKIKRNDERLAAVMVVKRMDRLEVELDLISTLEAE